MNIIKTAYAAGLLALAGTLSLSAEYRSVFTDAPGLVGEGSWGTTRTETYDVAVHLPLSEMEGLYVESVTFPVFTDDAFTDFSIWLTKELTLENKVNVPDIASVAAEAADGKISVTFAEPYEIPEGGLYIGYSFTVESKETVIQKYPVAVTPSEDNFDTGFWVHTSNTYKNRWTNLEPDRELLPVFEVVLAGVGEYAAKMTIPEEIYTVSGEEIEIPVTLINFGGTSFSKLTINETVDGSTLPVEVELGADVPALFGVKADRVISLPAISGGAARDLTLSVAALDGGANLYADESVETLAYVCSSRPVHRPLFEEYTGTGCGYCPRGALGMEKLQEIYGDLFVGVAYHCEDVMSIAETEDYPNFAPAQPDSYLDRYVQADPYFGFGEIGGSFGIDKVWAAQQQIFAPAHLELTCSWTDAACEEISATADFSFVRDYTGADFRMVYVLCADGLKGSGRDWMQGNYYSGNDPSKWPEDFSVFIDSTNPMTDMTYDHVAVLMPEKNGVVGSVPADIVADAPLSHSYTLNLADAVSTKGVSLIQDKGKLFVVAALVDAATGKVVNSARSVPGESFVVDLPVSTEEDIFYFNLHGVRVDGPQKGVTVKVTRHSDGRISTEKIIF